MKVLVLPTFEACVGKKKGGGEKGGGINYTTAHLDLDAI